MRPQAKLFAN